ncbi:Protein Sel-1-like 3 [Manis pentadactyla]|nr:Protein Sel-1-like 3 [Manis pentadactyla]
MGKLLLIFESIDKDESSGNGQDALVGEREREPATEREEISFCLMDAGIFVLLHFCHLFLCGLRSELFPVSSGISEFHSFLFKKFCALT